VIVCIVKRVKKSICGVDIFMSNNIYAIFIDIDGTLMERGIIPQQNIDTIALVRKLGHKVFINTGRSYAYIPKEVFDKVQFDGVVAGIGAYVRYGDEIVRSITIPENQLIELADYFLSIDAPCVFEGEEKLLYLNIDSKKNDKLIVKDSSDFSSIYKGVRISKVTIGRPLLENEIEMLEPNFSVFQHDRYAEFALKGCSKSSGMEAMLKRIGIGRKNCIAIGDSINDVEMLKYAGISVAMGNSPYEIKELCDYISETADNAGVAAALQKIILCA